MRRGVKYIYIYKYKYKKSVCAGEAPSRTRVKVKAPEKVKTLSVWDRQSGDQWRHHEGEKDGEEGRISVHALGDIRQCNLWGGRGER